MTALLVFLALNLAHATDGEDFLLLVDAACWNTRGLTKSQAKLEIAPGLTVQHKSSPSSLQVLAVTAHAISQVNNKYLNQLPCVQHVEPNARVYATALDPRQNEQYALPALGHSRAEQLFYHPIFGLREAVVIAIVDTGVQLDHPDLQTRLWHGPSGEVGYDFVNGDADPSDDNGHGTHVAGIAAAQRDNGIGIKGIMGDWAQLMAIKSLGADGGGELADVINGIRFAADHGADVINVSLASQSASQALADTIQYAISKGAVVVAAAGNEGRKLTVDNFMSPISYASGIAGLIGVGAFDALDFSRPAFSNYGPDFVEISAPGAAGIYTILSTFKDSRYLGLNGTSQATPMVSAAAALSVGFLRAQGLHPRPTEVEDWIEKSAIEDPGLVDSFFNGRRLNLENLAHFLLRSTVVQSTGGFDE